MHLMDKNIPKLQRNFAQIHPVHLCSILGCIVVHPGSVLGCTAVHPGSVSTYIDPLRDNFWMISVIELLGKLGILMVDFFRACNN